MNSVKSTQRVNVTPQIDALKRDKILNTVRCLSLATGVRVMFNRSGIFAMLVLLLFATILGQCSEKPSIERPHIPAVKVNAPPKIDGNLDDEAWSNAPKVTGFWRYDKDELAEEQTEVMICYDDAAIYIGFICHDSQPNLIRAQQRKRGGGLGSDDSFGVVIDPLNQPRIFGDTDYTFTVNPLGTQDEWVPGGAAAKIEWRGDWQAAVKIVEKGWQGEIAIPFRIFRLPRKPKSFSVSFYRSIPAPRLIFSTFPYKRGQAVANTAEWGPLDLPKFKPPILFMPSTTLVLGGEGNKGARSGLDIKQHLPNGLQWQMAINPDFRNVEDVVETIDFTYVPRMLPDRRPFFTEGRSYFPWGTVFHSRLVKDVLVGTKLFGKVGRTQVGILSAYESNSQLTIASRFKYDLDKNWSVETDYGHRTKTGRSQAFRVAFDGYAFEGKEWRWSFGGSFLRAGSDSWGFNLGRFAQSPGRVGFGLGYSETGDLRPSVGFKPETNYRELYWHISYDERFEKGPILTLDFFAYGGWRRFRSGSQKGQLLDKDKSISFHTMGKEGWSVSASYNLYERPPFKDRTLHFSVGWNTFDRYRSGYASLSLGKRAGQSYRFLTLTQSFRLSDKFSVNLDYERISHEQRTYQLVISGVYDLTQEQSLVFRWVKGSVPEYGEPRKMLPIDNFYLGFRQFSRKGLDIYLLLGDPNARTTHFMLMAKFIRVF